MTKPSRERTPCILVRLNRACDEFVVTGNLRLVTSSYGTFKTGRNEPTELRDDLYDWRTRKSFLQPELSDDGADGFVFAHPVDAETFLINFAGGTRLMGWALRRPGEFRRGEYVAQDLVTPTRSYWKALGVWGDEPSDEQIWAAYRVLIRAGMAEDMPEADWIRQRLGVGA